MKLVASAISQIYCGQCVNSSQPINFTVHQNTITREREIKWKRKLVPNSIPALTISPIALFFFFKKLLVWQLQFFFRDNSLMRWSVWCVATIEQWTHCCLGMDCLFVLCIWATVLIDIFLIAGYAGECARMRKWWIFIKMSIREFTAFINKYPSFWHL